MGRFALALALFAVILASPLGIIWVVDRGAGVENDFALGVIGAGGWIAGLATVATLLWRASEQFGRSK